MARTRARLRLEVDASAAYEFLISLHVFAEAYPPMLNSPNRPRPSARLSSTLQRLGSQGSLWNHLLGLATELRPKNVAGLLQHLASIDPLELVLHFVGYYQRPTQEVPRELIAAALDGDAAARERLARRIAIDYEEERPAMTRVLSMPVDTLARLIQEVLTGWQQEVFGCEEEEIGKPLVEDARAKRALINTAPDRFIQMLTGVDYAPPRRIRNVLLIPSFAIWPALLCVAHKSTMIFCYPVAPDSPEGTGFDPGAKLARAFGALGDGTRLQIIRELAGGSRTPEELSRVLQLPVTTVRSELAQLRTAGLLRLKMGHQFRYSVRPEAVAGLERSLSGLLRPDA